MRYPTISAFLLATTLPAAMTAPVGWDEAGYDPSADPNTHVAPRRVADLLDAATTADLAALDAEESGQTPPPPHTRYTMRRRDDDDVAAGTPEAGLSEDDIGAILARAAATTGSGDESGGSASSSFSAEEASPPSSRGRRRSLSAWAKRACRQVSTGQDGKYRTFDNCERNVNVDEDEADEARPLLEGRGDDESAAAVREFYNSQAARRAVPGWVSRRMARRSSP